MEPSKLPGIKQSEIRKCSTCNKGVAHSGDLQFFRVKIESCLLAPDAIQEQAGLESFFGGGSAAAAIAQAIGPNRDLAKIVSQTGWIWLCQRCFLNIPSVEALPPVCLASLLEQENRKQRESENVETD